MRIISVPVLGTSTAYRIDLDKPNHQDWLAWRFVTGETVDEIAAAISTSPDVIDEVIQAVSDRTASAKQGPRTGISGDYTYYYLRKDVIEVANYILERFETLSARRAGAAGIDTRNLQNLWGCDFLIRNKALGERMKGGDRWSIVETPFNEMAEAIWPMDHAFVVAFDDGIRLFRFVSMTPQQVRGRASVIPPSKKILRATYGIFSNSGAWECNEFIVGLFGGQWRHIDAADNVKSASWLDWVSEHLLPSVLTARYNWHVAFGTIANGPRVLLPTNPVAALNLFRNREKDPGATRRQRLKHWVSEHYRTRESDLEFVCHHLRGNTEFQWYDLSCELFVSEYDLNMAAFFKKQAGEWRSRRIHNRVKARSIGL